jgi:hypothetical protein
MRERLAFGPIVEMRERKCCHAESWQIGRPVHRPRIALYWTQLMSYGCRTSSSYSSRGISRTSVTAMPITGSASSGGNVRSKRMGLEHEICQ